jgi:hypothetical protein
MTTMGKQRSAAGRPKQTEPTKQMIASFRGTPAYAEWFDGLVEHCRDDSGYPTLPASSVIQRALISLAKEVGYDSEPPR